MREITSPLGGFLSPFGQRQATSPLAIYAVLGFTPPLVLDFESEKYFTGGSATTFDSALTTSRAGNARMVDSDGSLKWAPHNLVTYSEQFDQWSLLSQGSGVTPVVTANQGDSPVGIATADRVQFSRATSETVDRSVVRALNVSTKNGALYKFRVWMKSFDGSSYEVTVFNNYAGGGGTVVTVTPEWQLFEYEDTATADSSTSQFVIGIGYVSSSELSADVLLWGAHAYRSDHGGMVNNPDRGDSYVPTTTAARYLPRRNHHVYNGTEWVNEGLLVEPTASTNLITYSEDFTDASWGEGSGTGALAVDATGPDGQTSAVTLVDSGVGGGGSVSVNKLVNVNTATNYTFSVFLKADGLSWAYLFCPQFTTPANGGAYFNLATGEIGTVDAGFTANIQDFGGGWYRCSVTFTTDATDTSGRVDIWAADADGDFTVNLDGTSSILIYGAQFEALPYASSYIPTAGATVTRAADVTTISGANAPWPEPVVIGEELVTNGTFDTDISGWTDSGSTSTYSSGAIQVSHSSLASGPYQTFTTVTGRVYRATVDLISSTSFTANTKLRCGDGSVPDAGLADSQVISAPGTYELFFVATSSASYVYLRNDASATTVWDNISIKEINPLAVSIQMEGLMTYADTGASVILTRWRNGVPGLQINIQTDGSNVGEAFFYQWSDASVLDFVSTNNEPYSPGINVPFNISSRHGTTFVNGAVDGTVLTANLTPTALPDLSATDLDLAVSGGPMIISKVRIWADDITDAGIGEAST